MWGHRFEKLVTYQRENGEYRIDFSRFHNTYPINIPTVSAARLEELREAGLHPEEAFQPHSLAQVRTVPLYQNDRRGCHNRTAHNRSQSRSKRSFSQRRRKPAIAKAEFTKLFDRPKLFPITSPSIFSQLSSHYWIGED